jgi:hypothetical protein
MRSNVHVVTLLSSSHNVSPRLTDEEVETLFRFAAQIHDYEATTPAEPIFWHRDDNEKCLKFWN